jgi:hypothetical protein
MTERLSGIEIARSAAPCACECAFPCKPRRHPTKWPPWSRARRPSGSDFGSGLQAAGRPRHVSLIGVFALAACASIAPPREHVADAPQFIHINPVRPVADPATGSRHNRGCAVDLTLYDLKTGRAAEMPSLYDAMSERAHPTYAGSTAKRRSLRDFLRRQMEAEGFAVSEYEWRHFDYLDWKSYAIQNVRFEAIGANK